MGMCVCFLFVFPPPLSTVKVQGLISVPVFVVVIFVSCYNHWFLVSNVYVNAYAPTDAVEAEKSKFLVPSLGQAPKLLEFKLPIL